jgi:hypothetical protein
VREVNGRLDVLVQLDRTGILSEVSKLSELISACNERLNGLKHLAILFWRVGGQLEVSDSGKSQKLLQLRCFNKLGLVSELARVVVLGVDVLVPKERQKRVHIDGVFSAAPLPTPPLPPYVFSLMRPCLRRYCLTLLFTSSSPQ